jgi:hypothetical protein
MKNAPNYQILMAKAGAWILQGWLETRHFDVPIIYIINTFLTYSDTITLKSSSINERNY